MIDDEMIAEMHHTRRKLSRKSTSQNAIKNIRQKIKLEIQGIWQI